MDNDFMVGSGFKIDDRIIVSKLDVKENDIILMTVDLDKCDVDIALGIYQMMAKIFPNNKIATTFKGIDIKVEKNEYR